MTTEDLVHHRSLEVGLGQNIRDIRRPKGIHKFAAVCVATGGTVM